MEESAEQDSSIPSPLKLPFIFTGKASEYFKIWIVNTVLSIVTLGLYSPWAKVRARRYIYGHSFVDGHSFDYHANPVTILKGRLIVGALFLLFYFGEFLSTYVSMAGAAAIFFLTPWILVKSLRFNLANTSYRNLRFNFEKSYREVYALYFWRGFLTVITFGLYFPMFMLHHHSFVLSHAGYGSDKFRFRMQEGFYGIYIRALLVQIAGGIVVFVAFTLATSMIATVSSPALTTIFGFLITFLGYAVFVFTAAYVRAHTINYLCLNTSLGGLDFGADLDFLELGVIYVTNFFAIVCTLGLATPWALIRARRYRMECMHVHALGPQEFEKFRTDERQTDSAEGDAAADFFDIDVGF